ncbi:hypothetical protein MUK42_23106 [Musa troglodytarum]|uniref:Uncharacterized protein n=1 Tax=Musa troglodytarum TaxID=320322 RepID=A0A9E7GA18_9LILI|nr:hypothetical protein MUK42_23106 [Musa troglodytarum]
MTAAPNIEMISAFLRSCDLGRVGAAHLVEVSDERAGEVTVEPNPETALPCHWEHCLDMRYINRETGTRTTKDPRTAASYSSSYQSRQDSSSDDSCFEIGGSDDDEDTPTPASPPSHPPPPQILQQRLPPAAAPASCASWSPRASTPAPSAAAAASSNCSTPRSCSCVLDQSSEKRSTLF